MDKNAVARPVLRRRKNKLVVGEEEEEEAEEEETLCVACKRDFVGWFGNSSRMDAGHIEISNRPNHANGNACSEGF